MSEVEKLIAETGGGEAEHAVMKLVEFGTPVIQHIVDAIHAGSSGNAWRLSTVLSQIHNPEAVPVLIGLMSDEDPPSDSGNSHYVALSAIKALGNSNEPEAVEALVEALRIGMLDPDGHSGRIAHCADALGTLRRPETIGMLNDAVDRISNAPHVAPAIAGEPPDEKLYIDEDLLSTLLRLIIALAKLGEHDSVSKVIALTGYIGSSEYSVYQTVRAEAAKALQHTVGPGAFAAIRSSLRDEYYEVRLEAMYAAFYLGAREAISELIECRDDEHPFLSNNIPVILEEITGASFFGFEERDNMLSWWEANQDYYEPGICYRFGQPVDLEQVILSLKYSDKREGAIKELRTVTGENFGFNPYIPIEKQTRLFSDARSWWAENGARYEKGALHKYGRQIDLRNI